MPDFLLGNLNAVDTPAQPKTNPGKPKADQDPQDTEYLIGAKVLPKIGAVVLIIGLAFLVSLGVQSHHLKPLDLWWLINAGAAGLIIWARFLKEDREAFSEILEAVGSSGLFLNFAAGYGIQHLYGVPIYAALILGHGVANVLNAHLRKSPIFLYLGALGGLIGSLIPFYFVPHLATTALLLATALVLCFTGYVKKWAVETGICGVAYWLAAWGFAVLCAKQQMPIPLELATLTAVLVGPLPFIFVTFDRLPKSLRRELIFGRLFLVVSPTAVCLFTAAGSSPIGPSVAFLTLYAGGLAAFAYLFRARPRLSGPLSLPAAFVLILLLPGTAYAAPMLYGTSPSVWIYLVLAAVLPIVTELVPKPQRYRTKAMGFGLVSFALAMLLLNSKTYDGSIPIPVPVGSEIAFWLVCAVVPWLYLRPIRALAPSFKPYLLPLVSAITLVLLLRPFYLIAPSVFGPWSPMLGMLNLEMVAYFAFVTAFLIRKIDDKFLILGGNCALFLSTQGSLVDHPRAVPNIQIAWLVVGVLIGFIASIFAYRKEEKIPSLVNDEKFGGGTIASTGGVVLACVAAGHWLLPMVGTFTDDYARALFGGAVSTFALSIAALIFKSREARFVAMLGCSALAVVYTCSSTSVSANDWYLQALGMVLTLATLCLAVIGRFLEKRGRGEALGPATYLHFIVGFFHSTRLVFECLNHSSVSMNVNAAISLFWIALAGITLAAGFIFKVPEFRYASFGAFVVAVFKVFLVDLAALDSAIRVMVCIALGVVLMLGGYAYIKRRENLSRPG